MKVNALTLFSSLVFSAISLCRYAFWSGPSRSTYIISLYQAGVRIKEDALTLFSSLVFSAIRILVWAFAVHIYHKSVSSWSPNKRKHFDAFQSVGAFCDIQ